MSATSHPTPQKARELIDVLLKEAEEKLLTMMTQVIEAELENRNIVIAHSLVVQQPDGTFKLAPAAEVLIELGHGTTVEKALRLLLHEAGVTDAKLDFELASWEKQCREREN